jgi:hypothetical protein
MFTLRRGGYRWRNAGLGLGIGLLAAVLPVPAPAETGNTAGGSAANATARVDFRVVIPKFLRLQVGSAGGAVDRIDMAPGPAQLATSPSTTVGGTGGLGGGAVAVRVQAAPGPDVVNLTYRTTDETGAGRAALSDGANSVPWNTVKVATGGASAASLAHPVALADGSATEVGVVTPVPEVAGIIDLNATWTYSWNDGGVSFPASASGGYTGRVAYKLSTP